MLAGQRQHLVVEAMLDVAQFLDGADFLAKRLDVGEQPFLIGRVHGCDSSFETTSPRAQVRDFIKQRNLLKQSQSAAFLWKLPFFASGGMPASRGHGVLRPVQLNKHPADFR